MALSQDGRVLGMKPKKIGKGMIHPKRMTMSWNKRVLGLKEKNRRVSLINEARKIEKGMI